MELQVLSPALTIGPLTKMKITNSTTLEDHRQYRHAFSSILGSHTCKGDVERMLDKDVAYLKELRHIIEHCTVQNLTEDEGRALDTLLEMYYSDALIPHFSYLKTEWESNIDRSHKVPERDQAAFVERMLYMSTFTELFTDRPTGEKIKEFSLVPRAAVDMCNKLNLREPVWQREEAAFRFWFSTSGRRKDLLTIHLYYRMVATRLSFTAIKDVMKPARDHIGHLWEQFGELSQAGHLHLEFDYCGAIYPMWETW